jgi:hypothetical protein
MCLLEAQLQGSEFLEATSPTAWLPSARGMFGANSEIMQLHIGSKEANL